MLRSQRTCNGGCVGSMEVCMENHFFSGIDVPKFQVDFSRHLTVKNSEGGKRMMRRNRKKEKKKKKKKTKGKKKRKKKYIYKNLLSVDTMLFPS